MGFTEYARNVELLKDPNPPPFNKPQQGVFVEALLAKGGDPGWGLSQKRLDHRIGNNQGWLSYSESGGGFSTYLKRFWLLDNSILVAELPRSSGGYELTAMDLNGCLANENGNFVWATGWGSKPRAWKFDENELGKHSKNETRPRIYDSDGHGYTH